MSEHEIQCAIVQYLERVLPTTIRVVAVSNNPRNAITGFKEKRRGMKRGFPDLILTGAFHGLLEVKKEGGRLKIEQREWADWLSSQQVPIAVVRSIDDVRETLAAWGVNVKEAG